MSRPSATGYTFVSHVPAVIVSINTASLTGIKKATQHVHKTLMGNLSNAKSRKGRTYRIPGTSRTYTASAPGEYPALRLGDLRSSVHWKIQGSSGIVHTNLLHGAYLEDPKNTRTEAEGRRRWLRRTFEEEDDMIKEILYGAGNVGTRRWF